MNGKENEILDRIFALLDMTNPEMLLRASKSRGISSHVKIALEAFALETLRRSNKRRNPRQHLSNDAIMNKRGKFGRKTEGYSRVSQGNTEVDQIADILLSSKRFASKAAIVNFAKLNKLQVDIGSKDSKARAAKKLSKAIVVCPVQEKKKTLAMLYEMFGEQTRGWIDIIRPK